MMYVASAIVLILSSYMPMIILLYASLHFALVCINFYDQYM